jgi:hypothetical protein
VTSTNIYFELSHIFGRSVSAGVRRAAAPDGGPARPGRPLRAGGLHTLVAGAGPGQHSPVDPAELRRDALDGTRVALRELFGAIELDRAGALDAAHPANRIALGRCIGGWPTAIQRWRSRWRRPEAASCSARWCCPGVPASSWPHATGPTWPTVGPPATPRATPEGLAWAAALDELGQWTYRCVPSRDSGIPGQGVVEPRRAGDRGPQQQDCGPGGRRRGLGVIPPAGPVLGHSRAHTDSPGRPTAPGLTAYASLVRNSQRTARTVLPVGWMLGTQSPGRRF